MDVLSFTTVINFIDFSLCIWCYWSYVWRHCKSTM